MVKNQKLLNDLKKEISVSSKKNFTLEREIRNLDQKIALLIRNRITLEEVMATSGDISLVNKTVSLKDKREREHYGQLFHLLQRDTRYIAQLARLVKLGEIDNLLQTVMFTLYGNQYDEHEEHLLLSMFQRVLAEEFNQAKSIGSLLRANTALTRMMTTYTRRGPGQQYLKNTLTSVLKEITSQPDLILEINPSKVYETYINWYETQTGSRCQLPRKVSAEVAADNVEVKKIIGPRINQLQEIADKFLNRLISSADQVPYGIRWICKQIRELVKEKFPQATREQSCSLIGGFYLLRFVNPAIVTPQAFMLVETKLSVNTRRNLTLLAKILQNLANNHQFGGVKEFYMAPLNGFLQKNRNRVNEFLEKLTRVDDLQNQLNIDKYIALGKTEETYINISLNEMYFVHALLNEHIDILEQDDNNGPLRRILAELGAAPPQMPRKENANVDLKLDDSYIDKSEDPHEINPDTIYQDTKYLLFNIIKQTPTIGAQMANDIDAILNEAGQYARQKRNGALLAQVEKVRSNCKQLVKMGRLNKANNYAQLRRDAVQELIHYEEQISRSAADYERLRSVLNNIREHNKFLQQQFEAYKEYLENVRANCTSKKGNTKPQKRTKAEKRNRKGPFKFSHVTLEKDGIIIESEVPQERRSNIFFSFTSPSPGVFDVAVMYKSRGISEIRLQLDDLLEKQQNNDLEFETDFLKMNINLLIYLLNKLFIS